jgi:hypothetical protein
MTVFVMKNCNHWRESEVIWNFVENLKVCFENNQTWFIQQRFIAPQILLTATFSQQKLRKNLHFKIFDCQNE